MCLTRELHVSTRQRREVMQKQSYFQGRCCNRLAMCSGHSLAHIINSWSGSRATVSKNRLWLCISIRCHQVMWPVAQAEGIKAGHDRFSEPKLVERRIRLWQEFFHFMFWRVIWKTQESQRPRKMALSSSLTGVNKSQSKN